MQNLVFRPARVARLGLVLAAGLALLMPLPVRCVGCVAAAETCPHCVAAEPVNVTPAAPDACCQRPSAYSPATSEAASTVKHGTPACGCVLKSAPRTVPTVEKLVSSADLVALHATVVAFATPTIHSAADSVSTLDILPPSVPHRILHCSWII
jgi:hypothetical protein